MKALDGLARLSRPSTMSALLRSLRTAVRAFARQDDLDDDDPTEIG